MVNRFDRMREIVLRSLELDENERESFLDSACGNDADLRREIAELLAEGGDIPTLLNTGGSDALVRRMDEAGDPERVGPYRILRRLGEGGMGTVYLARQEEPIRRDVALKLIKLGMDTKSVIARFEAERQALAMMNHPNIAKVHDAGATELGRPYFVMEYAPGKPITSFCDEQRLDTRERLQLFVTVCQAIHHAHQRGIIHRDVKPSNVLVGIQDGTPIPKVIDFGVAKATERSALAGSFFTEEGQLVGTPEYMSPEQAGLSTDDLDVTTDVYSLGVLLYRLLTGELPFGAAEPGTVGIDEMRRRIREDDPPRPSTRISTLGAGAEPVAQRRGATVSALAKELRGELDWITMRAMEKSRVRRYASASELAHDIERHLRHEPVAAGPPSATYRLSKLVRRHRGAFAAVATVFVALAAGLVVSTTMYVRAERERARATTEARTAQRINDFLQSMLASADPEVRGRDTKIVDVLDNAAESVDEQLEDEPAIRAAVLRTLGNTYDGLGLSDEAVTLLSRALDIQRGIFHTGDFDLLWTLNDLGVALKHAGRYEDAAVALREAISMQRQADSLHRPTDVGDPTDLTEELTNLGVVLKHLGDFDAAESLFRESLARARRDDADDPRLASYLGNLAVLLSAKGEIDEAITLQEEALALLNRLGDGRSTNAVMTRGNLATAFVRAERYEEAESLFVPTIALSREVLGEHHPSVALYVNNYAWLQARMGHWAEAESTSREAVALYREIVGPEHPRLGMALSILGGILLREERPAEAEPVFREALRIRTAALPEGHSDIATTAGQLGECLLDLGRSDAAEPLLVQSWETFRVAPSGATLDKKKQALERLVRLYESSRPSVAAAYRAQLASLSEPTDADDAPQTKPLSTANASPEETDAP